MNRHLHSQIRYFMAVAEDLHFRQASERLHVAQPAISRAIRQLESQLGVALLKRDNRNVSLTAAGAIFYRECQKAAEIMESAEESANRASRGEKGHLKIGYIDFAINGPLPKHLSQFYKEFPDISIELQWCNSHQQIDDLESGRLDIGFLTGPIMSYNINHVTIHQAPYVVLLPLNHPLKHQEEISLHQLADEPFILGSQANWRHFISQLNSYCLEAGFIPRVVHEAPNSDSIFGLVAARMGVTIYPDCELNHDRKDLIIRPLKSHTARLSIELAWHRNNRNPALASFIATKPSSNA
ncbi:MAG: LysR family transcriptional regulator [Pseudomonadota bacterium]